MAPPSMPAPPLAGNSHAGTRFDKTEPLARNYLLAPYAAWSYVTGHPDSQGRLATRRRSVVGVRAPVHPRHRCRAEGGGMIMRSIRGAIRSGALLLGVAAMTFSPAQARRAPATITHRSTGSTRVSARDPEGEIPHAGIEPDLRHLVADLLGVDPD